MVDKESGAKGPGSGKGNTPPLPSESVGEQVVNSLTSGVIALDRRGNIIRTNPAAGAFLQADLHPGENFGDLAFAAPFIEVIEEAKTARHALARREIILPLADGAKKEIGLSASLLSGPDEYNGIIFLFTDMTERRALERSAELNRQLAQIGELTAGVVHELRNPVSVISGMAELLMRKLGREDDRHEIAETICEEAQQLERSIAQFLGFARPFDLEPVLCYPEAIVERSVQLCRRRAQQKGVVFETHLEEGLPQMRADLTRTAQALANLIGNAVDAVAPGTGKVRVEVESSDDRIVFAVVDNGPGVHVGSDDDLFSPFFTQKESGTGLGLSIVHKIVTAHHGVVKYSNLVAGGARFEMTLPIGKRTTET